MRGIHAYCLIAGSLKIRIILVTDVGPIGASTRVRRICLGEDLTPYHLPRQNVKAKSVIGDTRLFRVELVSTGFDGQ